VKQDFFKLDKRFHKFMYFQTCLSYRISVTSQKRFPNFFSYLKSFAGSCPALYANILPRTFCTHFQIFTTASASFWKYLTTARCTLLFDCAWAYSNTQSAFSMKLCHFIAEKINA